MNDYMQEGFSTINDIMKGTKEHNIVSLSHQQTILTEQTKKLREMIEAV
jgi:hypothetical protein